ncbi:MAG TPA: DUF3025 domain-containing protein [Ramlibacter sp.]|nr:DUF3025 domain-containing protein [Ramlibacter sp.]
MEARLTVDWDAPWFTPWRDVGEPMLEAWRTQPLPTALNRCTRAPVRFVAQTQLDGGEPYEHFIFRTRTCPVRENAHDFFNGLAWLKFPGEKSQLNALQAEEIARDGIAAARGAVRDAITVFDENGAFLEAPQPLWEALAARDWHRLFIALRPMWCDAQVTVFGHALLEKLLTPRKDLTAHVWVGPRQITRQRLAAKPFTPLPLAGIPGWFQGNDEFSFYDDPHVFRSARRNEG